MPSALPLARPLPGSVPTRVALAALLLMLSLLAAAPTPASAAAPDREFYGVNVPLSGEAITSGDVSTIRSARIGTGRLTFAWNSVQRAQDGPYDWSYYDVMIERAARAGMRVLPTLEGSPEWVAPRSSYPPADAAGRAGFAAFTTAAVDRYGRDGEFWRTHPDVPYRPILQWQVWNEPNLAYWWYEKPNARQYLTLLRSISTAIRKGDRKADVVLAGLPETHGIPMAEYLTQLYRASSNFKSYFDVIAIHPFARGWAGVEGALYRVREVTRRFRDDKTPVLITEIGWATGGGKDLEFQVTTRKGQADRLRSTFRELRDNRKKYNVQGVIWYAWKDFAPFDWWIHNCGLFDRTGKAKPSWAVFRSFSRATVRR